MSLENEQTYESQVKVRELKRKLSTNKRYGTKLRHDSAVGMHISRRTGMCMCLDTCCQSEAGCKCKSCRCRLGEFNHGDVIPDAGTQQREKESEVWEE